MKIHTRGEKQPDGSKKFRCGFRLPAGAMIPHTADAVCKRCDALCLMDEIKSEEEEERLIEAGFLEPNYGPNRQHNEY